ncbi:expressed unknown protein [Seminavis robusta]|uniref:Uncharacterized protein n=1 Tax=Seminavis robusta TaxID=568900 RepID=A0A9N8DP45_9STRA|nr:expressed unknown protein [Seminavis robusta]|eukprot:Sro163_g073080.1 n/a (311) ;mRNA; f:17722-18654
MFFHFFGVSILLVIFATVGTDATKAFDRRTLDDKEVDDFLANDARAEQRELEEGSGGLFEACNDDKPCQEEGLTCVRWVTRKRCVPINCLKEELLNFQNSFDRETYFQRVSAAAGVDNSNGLFQWLGGGGIPMGIRPSGRKEAFFNALENNPEFLNGVSSIGRKCFFGDANATSTTSDSKQTSLSWTGYTLEGGLILPDFAWSTYSAASGFDGRDGDGAREFNRYCVGVEPGAGLFTGIIGAFGWTPVTGSPEDLLACGYLMADLDLGFLVGAGVAAGVTFNGIVFFEYELSSSLLAIGGGAGVAVCGAA